MAAAGVSGTSWWLVTNCWRLIVGSAKGYTFRQHWKERVNCSRCTLEGDQNIWEVGGSVVLQGGQGGWEEVKYFGRGCFCVNLPNFNIVYHNCFRIVVIILRHYSSSTETSVTLKISIPLQSLFNVHYTMKSPRTLPHASLQSIRRPASVQTKQFNQISRPAPALRTLDHE